MKNKNNQREGKKHFNSMETDSSNEIDDDIVRGDDASVCVVYFVVASTNKQFNKLLMLKRKQVTSHQSERKTKKHNSAKTTST